MKALLASAIVALVVASATATVFFRSMQDLEFRLDVETNTTVRCHGMKIHVDRSLREVLEDDLFDDCTDYRSGTWD